jgi:hypothetical protein
VSNAQDGIKDYGVVWSGVHNDTICGDSMFILHDFAFYIDNGGRLFRVFDWEDISRDRIIEYVYFEFKVLLRGSTHKNKKYAEFIVIPRFAKRPVADDRNFFLTNCKKKNETKPSFQVVNISPDDVIGVELTSVEIETKDGERYTLSGFPKYSEIRRKEQK